MGGFSPFSPQTSILVGFNNNYQLVFYTMLVIFISIILFKLHNNSNCYLNCYSHFQMRPRKVRLLSQGHILYMDRVEFESYSVRLF